MGYTDEEINEILSWEAEEEEDSKREPEIVKVNYNNIVAETEKAILFNFGKEEYWFPKSQITDLNKKHKIFNCPKWLYDTKFN